MHPSSILIDLLVSHEENLLLFLRILTIESIKLKPSSPFDDNSPFYQIPLEIDTYIKSRYAAWENRRSDWILGWWQHRLCYWILFDSQRYFLYLILPFIFFKKCNYRCKATTRVCIVLEFEFKKFGKVASHRGTYERQKRMGCYKEWHNFHLCQTKSVVSMCTRGWGIHWASCVR